MKNICGGLFMTLNSHENDLKDLVAQSISWRLLIGNTLTQINHGCSLSWKWYFRGAIFVRGFLWELHITDYFHDGFSYFRDYFRLSWNLRFLVVEHPDSLDLYHIEITPEFLNPDDDREFINYMNSLDHPDTLDDWSDDIDLSIDHIMINKIVVWSTDHLSLPRVQEYNDDKKVAEPPSVVQCDYNNHVTTLPEIINCREFPIVQNHVTVTVHSHFYRN